MSKYKLYNANCMDILPTIDDESIDCILCDLPYGETGSKWDKILPLDKLFKEYERIITDEGAILLNGTFKFGNRLFDVAPHLYKYEWVWEKPNGTNVPMVNYQPFRVHEFIYVFSKGRASHGKRTPIKYNPQKVQGKPYKIYARNKVEDGHWKGKLNRVWTDCEDGLRYPKSIQYFKKDKSKLHPNQKPAPMLEYFIKTYTDEGATVLDNCMGSGPTGVACANTNRKFIGIELDEDYFKIAEDRIKGAYYERL